MTLRHRDAVSGRGFPDWTWFNERNLDRVADLLAQHLQLTALAMLLGILVATPLGVLAVRRRRLYAPLLNVTGVLFTIPSVALFIVLLAFAGTGLGLATPLIGLTLYTLLILFRNTVAGLDAVPRDVKETAEAMGYRPVRRLLRVELPLALPVYVAGVRIATVTTIGLVTITAFVGWGGLGQLFITGFQRHNPTEISVGIAGCVALAVVADLALVGLQRCLTPWAHAEA